MSENQSVDKYNIEGVEYSVPVYNKYLRNLRNGRLMFHQGQLPEFKGFGSDYHEGITLRAFFDDESLKTVQTKVLNPIIDLAKAHGIELYLSSLWTPHISISDLRCTDPTTRKELFKKADTAPVMLDAINTLKGKNVVFDTLLLGPAIVLAATHLPDYITTSRNEIEKLEQELGMTEKDFANIVHTTVARVKKLPRTTPNASDFNGFGRGIMDLHYSILRSPLVLRIGHAELMSNEEFEKLHEAELFKQLSTS